MTTPSSHQSSYRNFRVAVYARAYEVKQMADLDWLRTRFDVISRHLKVDKVYIETHRDGIMPDAATVEGARQFFVERGVQTAGGITYTINERNRYETYCYTRPEHRAKVREIAEYTAGFFDEMILDDFFFTDCKCRACIEAKGDRSWTAFRLQQMAEAAHDLVVGPARAVNPDVKVVVKYPNWYEHFQGLGFNLEVEPGIFDGLYTGTETRDPVLSNQHLQPYHGYLIFRFFESLKPGANGGGWVDPFGSRTVDRYAEQLWLTLFAKAPEVTLFDFGQIQRAIEPAQRGAWQDQARVHGIGFDFDAMMGRLAEGETATVAMAAGHAFETVDGVLDELGEPVGVKGYKPFHSSGEDFLQSYLGMLGIPIDLVPEFPEDAGTILLTEQAKYDVAIAEKIKAHLLDGKNVVITSGLYRALQGRKPGTGSTRIEDIVELEVTDRKALVSDFLMGWRQTSSTDAPILIPHVRYYTNDSWELISGMTTATGHPLLHDAEYAGSHLYLLTIPDNFNDLYKLPPDVLAQIRRVLMADLPVRVDGPAQVALFLYDNGVFVVESFLDEPTDITVILKDGADQLQDVLSDQALSGRALLDWWERPTGEVAFETTIDPHTYRVFRIP